MSIDTALHPTASLAGLAPQEVPDGYRARGLDGLSDGALVELVAGAVVRPKQAAADSFVLHAPLELLARSALLPLVEPASRLRARQRLVWLGATYQAAGDEVADVEAADPDASPDAATEVVGERSVPQLLARLDGAIAAGELDDADRAAAALAAALPPDQLSRILTDTVLPRLSAAAHGNILLFQLPRIAPRSRVVASSVRGVARELARHPDWALTWFDRRPEPPVGDGAATADGRGDGGDRSDLIDALVGPASPGDPGSTFIFPTMSLVETSGLAAELLDGPTRRAEVGRAGRDLLRVAAWSMVQDTPDHAPYGWSHCLTLPQAALGLAAGASDPSQALAVAATYVLAFRATLGQVVLDPDWAPPRPDGGDVLDALGASPAEAVAAVWHARPDQVGAVTARLASTAAGHHDAHLAKYTLACFDAAHTDPGAARLYLAAAASLGAWWAQCPSTDDPLGP